MLPHKEVGGPKGAQGFAGAHVPEVEAPRVQGHEVSHRHLVSARAPWRAIRIAPEDRPVVGLLVHRGDDGIAEIAENLEIVQGDGRGHGTVVVDRDRAGHDLEEAGRVGRLVDEMVVMEPHGDVSAAGAVG